jgi:asparagine synthase (glutamine-hydrolysing)
MCGIAGEIRFDQTISNPATVRAMCNAQIHRGPDDEGYYASKSVSLGIRRLAIIDLAKGLYPLRNERDTIHLVFNGEIYGFDTLRAELRQLGHQFRSKTDAETVLHAYEEWGTESLKKLNGMFAFALWDEPKQLLWIARDHFGIKPLYYYQGHEFLAFASEIKALLTHPGVPSEPNDRVIGNYLRRARLDDTQETFFQGLNRLAPAHHILVRPNGLVEDERYWTFSVSRELDGKISGEETETVRHLFLEAIGQQLVSDVPVGTCLSGGIDSSSVVCAIKELRPEGGMSTGQQIKTFSSVFSGDPIDESRYAREVCEVTKAEHNPVTPTADELWRDLPTLVRCQEEPFFSTSIYAQWRVMKRAKERGITVVLDGQGGDELLAGYLPYYLTYLRTLKKHRKYSKLLAEGILSFDLIQSFVRAYVRGLAAGTIARGKSLLTKKRTAGSHEAILVAPYDERIIKPFDDLATTLEMDALITSLPHLLRYEDKNSMWHSVEARVPFLDKRFCEYVAHLPLDRKLGKGWTKLIFRLAMTGILPEKIRLRRGKIGFETPEKRWIEVNLRGKLEEFFSDPNLTATKYYNAEAVRRVLRKPKLATGEVSVIWRILNLELWHREFFRETKA